MPNYVNLVDLEEERLQHDYVLANVSFTAAENESYKVCHNGFTRCKSNDYIWYLQLKVNNRYFNATWYLVVACARLDHGRRIFSTSPERVLDSGTGSGERTEGLEALARGS